MKNHNILSSHTRHPIKCSYSVHVTLCATIYFRNQPFSGWCDKSRLKTIWHTVSLQQGWVFYWCPVREFCRQGNFVFTNLPITHWVHWWRPLQPTSSVITDAKSADLNLDDFARKKCLDQPENLHNDSSEHSLSCTEKKIVLMFCR